MPRFLRAREQVELLAAWGPRKYIRLPDVRGDALDAMGFTQKKFQHNYYSWIDPIPDRDLEMAGLWYPVGNDWGEHQARVHGVHPLKAHAVVAATSPKRLWVSQNLGRKSNLGDAHLILSHPDPQSIPRLGGQSGSSNLLKAKRVMAAPDDPDAIKQAFLGWDKFGRPNRPNKSPKTWDFLTTLNDPESGGAYNYMAQPGVADSWAGQSMLWSREEYEKARRTGNPLWYPGIGTGEGLDKPKPEKKQNPETGEWELTGRLIPPGPSDVAGKVLRLGGAYARMRNAMRAGAARRQLPFTHMGQAAVWTDISGNPLPQGQPNWDLDLDSIEHPEELNNELWARRASGLIAPTDPDFRPVYH